ncbi:MAG: TlpA disulfide reductase family protein [Pyrinomonadaceae bacterium]
MKPLYFCLLAFAFCLVFSACRPAAAPVSVTNQPISINDIPNKNLPMPPKKPLGEMRWTKFDGKTNADGDDQRLDDLKGKVVILDFWATYCAPCLEEIPHLNELQTKHNSKGFEVIGLHVGGEEDRPKVPEFAEKLKINYTLATPEIALESFIFYQDTSIPQTLVLDREGKLVERFVGFDSETKNDLDKAVEKAFSQ